MGSFTEVVLAGQFRPDTPPEVLSAFAPLIRDDPPGAPGPSEIDPRPDLSELHVDLERLLELGWADGASFATEVSGCSAEDLARLWRQVIVVGAQHGTAYFPGEPHGALVARGNGSWTLTLRSHVKESASFVAAALAPLGRYLERDAEGPTFVGYVKFEYAPFPCLIWNRAGGFLVDRVDEADRYA